MAVPEIIDKLLSFLQKENIFTEECEVVYFMVEARKVIDQQKLNLPILKFYADWCVHSSKDRITPEIKEMSEQMYAGAVARINDPNSPVDHAAPVSDFVYMVNLRREVGSFLAQYGLPEGLIQTKEEWIQFVSILAKVLENQPIVEPCDDVQEILFEPAAPRCVIGVIVFKTPVNGQGYFRLMNAY